MACVCRAEPSCMRQPRPRQLHKQLPMQHTAAPKAEATHQSSYQPCRTKLGAPTTMLSQDNPKKHCYAARTSSTDLDSRAPASASLGELTAVRQADTLADNCQQASMLGSLRGHDLNVGALGSQVEHGRAAVGRARHEQRRLALRTHRMHPSALSCTGCMISIVARRHLYIPHASGLNLLSTFGPVADTDKPLAMLGLESCRKVGGSPACP